MLVLTPKRQWPRSTRMLGAWPKESESMSNVHVTRACERCSCEFAIAIRHVSRGRGRFCSRACANAGMTTRRDALCAHCGERFSQHACNASRGRRFCSLSCAGHARNYHTRERFWSRVDKCGPTPSHAPELGACWLWTGLKIRTGYGHVRFDRRMELTHRVAFFLAAARW